MSNKFFAPLFIAFLVFHSIGFSQDTVKVAPNLTVKNIPAIPFSIVNEVQPYNEYRSASFQSWHPVEKQMIVSTRFSNTFQLHMVTAPLGMRKQLTFYNESPSGAKFNPANGQYFIFSKDAGGNEFGNLFLYNLQSGRAMPLTKDQRAQNGGVIWNKNGTQIIYTSTRRNGKDRDVYLMDPLNPGSDKCILELEGGGWGVADWSENGQQLLLSKYVSVNESSVWIYNITQKKLEQVWPKNQKRSVNSPVSFGKESGTFYILSDEGSEFLRPVKVHLSNGTTEIMVQDINWGVEQYVLNHQQTHAAFVVNEEGIKRVYIQDLRNKSYAVVTGLPVGVVSGVSWHSQGKNVAFNFTTSNASTDVFEWNIENRKLNRWTESELGGMNLTDVPAPKLIKWKSFDGAEISGFLYEAPARFQGKRPVIINIHGGPEGQSLPVFVGRLNYFINELGISVIFPNVRGSVGYGKTFTDMDNGFKREESVKDIGSLLDWIAKWPRLDADRVMVTGGSYGGYMTLAVAFHYNDRIRCALDVVGISHFTTFLKNTEHYRRDLRRVEYGDERDKKMAAFFEKIAPLNNADKIKKPMFIVQGRNDPRVPYTEALQMVEKIESNGGIVWYLEASDEGHGFRKKSNQDYQFYATIAFIRKYLIND